MGISIEHNPFKISVGFIAEIEKLTFKFIWKSRETRIAKLLFKEYVN